MDILLKCSFVFFCLFIMFRIVLFYHNKQHILSLPPGPTPLPVIGNFHQLLTENLGRKVRKLHEKFGPIISLRVGSRIVILLGTHQAAKDLLQKRSNIYSSRPEGTIFERFAKGFLPIALPVGPKWKICHRLQASLLDSRWAQHQALIQDMESKQLIYDLLSTNMFSTQFSRYSSSLLSKLAYGKRIVNGDGFHASGAHEATRIVDALLLPAAIAEDDLPGFGFLFARFERFLEGVHRTLYSYFGENMSEALERTSWNWCKEILHGGNESNLSSKELSFLIGELSMIGSYTTTVVLELFVVACVLHPESVRQAQIELDIVLGHTRLPDFEDMQNLPYIKAFVKEVLRWRPLIPTGVPRAVTEDDEYMGYKIPRGSTVLATHWALDMDEDIFVDPSNFRPERWITNKNLPLSAFGFGKRICPGRHLACNSLEIVIARLLWAYNIGHSYGDGERIEFDRLSQEPRGLTSKMVPFSAAFNIRSPEHRNIIEKEWLVADKGIDTI